MFSKNLGGHGLFCPPDYAYVRWGALKGKCPTSLAWPNFYIYRPTSMQPYYAHRQWRN